MDEHEAEGKDERMILIHGFSNKEAVAIMRGVKSAVEDPAGIAFSVTTPNNLEWSVKSLIKEVREEHEYMKENPPS
jgi:ribosomal silencing factor RsfS